jgi:putative MATE family efflux protein
MEDSMAARSARSIPWRLVDLAWPIVGINLLQVTSLVVDAAMVGRSPEGEAGITGLGYAGQIAFLLMVAMIGLSVGAVALVARSHGAGEHDRAQHVLEQATLFTLGLGLAVSVLGNLVAGPILDVLGAHGEERALGLRYLRPLLLGAAFNYLNILFAAVLRGVGNTRLAFLVALGMNGLNVVLNYGLILGELGLPALGVQGAAIGTVVSQAVAAIAMATLLARGTVGGLGRPLAWRPVDRDLAVTLGRIGFPAALDVLVLNAGLLFIISLLGRLDQEAVGAHAVGLRIQSVAFVPGMSIAQATGAMVGAALGAQDVASARRIVWSSAVLSTGIMSVLALVLVVFAEPVVRAFGIGPGAMSAYAVTWLSLLGYGMPVVGSFLALGGLFQGSGDTSTPFRINAAVTFGFQIPAGWLLGFVVGWGAFGVWVAFPLSFVLKTFWACIAYRRGAWAVTGARV